MRLYLAVASVCSLSASALVAGQLPRLAEDSAIAYSKTAATDPVAQLQKKIDAGEVTLAFDEQRGYLPSLLRALDIPVSSQGLVFSRTSLQVDRIAPWSPRAIYFNDDVYVGWVQGGPIMEIASVDPKLGAVFYTIDQEQHDKPVIRREGRTCLQCHDSASTGGVPGFIMRSVVTDRYGYPVAAGTSATTDQTRLEDRWGGWYVTGTMGNLRHKGNAMVPLLAHEIGNVESYLSRNPVVAAGDVTSLAGKFDPEPYLTPHSDAVALLILAHQSEVHNLITRAGYEAARALAVNDNMTAVNAMSERLVRALLFVNAAPMTAPVEGTSSFAKEFAAAGPRDRRGRSLRELDLTTRLFRYPLSYLIYSEGFDALPPVVKGYVARRLRELAVGSETRPEFGHLSADDRQAIREILEDTKRGF
jgi:hypothetical protein